MHAATLRPNDAARFLWKEYRTLRGLWLAVLALGLFFQWLSSVLLPPTGNWAALCFSIALGTTVLYAVGAAATTFSVEHEEETYGFLVGLPTQWQTLFLGKLTFVVVSALALAVVLAFVGLVACRFGTPGGTETQQALAILGLAIVEAIAWGTLFSLLVKRPLVATMLTLVVGTLVMQLAVSVGGHATSLTDPKAYLGAVPLRLAIVACVFASALALARTWLTPRRSHRGERTVQTLDETDAAVPSRFGRFISAGTSSLAQYQSPTAAPFVRLLWQTFRQSWKSLLLPLPIAVFLAAGLMLVAAVIADTRYPELVVLALAVGVLLPPGIYGALVFGGDQRGRQYRFFAEHACRPRLVWLTRQLVWASTFIAVSALLVIALAERLMRSWRQDMLAHELAQLRAISVDASAMIVMGCLSAYAVGQGCSMLLRSEILAVFATCVSLFFVAAWSILMFGWELSAFWFVLPIAVGLMIATWLRTPDWITERNSWRHWLAPAISILVPAAAVFISVPTARLSQVSSIEFESSKQTIAPILAQYRAGSTLEARETANEYLAAIADLGPIRFVPVRPSDALERGAPPPSPTDSGAYSELENTVQNIYSIGVRDGIIETKNAFLDATKRATCRFEFVGFSTSSAGTWQPWHQNLAAYFRDRSQSTANPYSGFVAFMLDLADQAYGEESLDPLLSLLRASNHLRSDQPTSIFADQLLFESFVYTRIASWARNAQTTNERIREAIQQLTSHAESVPDPSESLVADREEVRRVLLDNELPLLFNGRQQPFIIHLAMLLNRLPWERERALKALDIAIADDIDRADRLRLALEGMEPSGSREVDNLRRVVASSINRYFGYPPFPANGESQFGHALPTLGDFELNARLDFSHVALTMATAAVHRRATPLLLALELYRRDHGEYPDKLARLVPDYLDQLPIDPYSGEPFRYLPHGVPWPLHVEFMGTTRIAADTPFIWTVGPWNVMQFPQLSTENETVLSHGMGTTIFPLSKPSSAATDAGTP